MLSELKKKIQNETIFATALEEAAAQVATDDEDIKDSFLDDPEVELIGAEEDPAVAKLVEDLPDDLEESEEDITEKDIEKMTESYIPESII